jgi:hypothetical protein
MAALCQGQPNPDERDRTGGWFPSLVHCEWSTNGECDSRYDCLGWSVGLTDQYLTERLLCYYYGDGDHFLETTDFDGFYAYYGYERVGSIDEADVLLYVDPDWADPYPPPPDSDPPWDFVGFTHAARVWEPDPPCQCGGPHWKMFGSKLNIYELIEHRRDQLNDGYYGSPSYYYKKTGN